MGEGSRRVLAPLPRLSQAAAELTQGSRGDSLYLVAGANPR